MAKFIYRMQNILDIKLKLESQQRLHTARQMQHSGKKRQSF